MARRAAGARSLSDVRTTAGREGGQAVKATFGVLLTRRRVAELIGVSRSTIRRWERAGVIRPSRTTVLKSPTTVFKPADVEFGRKLIGVLRRANGEVTLEEAAAIVRAGRRR